MAKRKLRKKSKNIAKQPKLKKTISEFLADRTIVSTIKVDIKKMLIEGHRGFLAMKETDLCNLFDKEYERMLEKMEELSNEQMNWMTEGKINALKEELKRAEAIYDIVFEDTFL